MRDHRKLRAFHLADQLVLEIYRYTCTFPREELFGLSAQIRRSSLSIPSNIVEGCARHGKADYIRFLDIAFASTRELEYQLSIAERLRYLKPKDYEEISSLCTETSKVLNGLLRALRK